MNRAINLLSAVLVLSSPAAAIAQQQRPRQAVDRVRVSKGKPTVYITFVRFGKREARYNHESDEGVWLRVHNNTRWPLVFDGSGWFTSENEEVWVFYGVEEVPKPRGEMIVSSPDVIKLPSIFEQPPVQPQETSTPPKTVEEKDCEAPPGDWGIDVVAPIRLPPGKSMILSVPRESLCKNLKIYLRYNYSWEKHDRYRPFDYEPEHRVYFVGADLPKAAR